MNNESRDGLDDKEDNNKKDADKEDDK